MIVKTTTSGNKIFKCPGCTDYHSLTVRKPPPDEVHPSWIYNDNPNKPTFQPSILAWCDWPEGKEVCHSFVTDGKIQFLDDCTHDLKGKTVDLIPWPHTKEEFGGIID